MKTSAAIFSLLTLLGITGTIVATSRLGREAKVVEPAPGLPVNVITLRSVMSVERNREFIGTIVAARRSRLAFERSARLVEALVDDGDTVAKGQVLARLDRRHLDAQLSELKAMLRQQKATLEELKSGPRKETIAATKAELAALAADVELKKSTLDRVEDLHNRGATSAQAFDEVRLSWKAASARRDALTRQLDELVAGTRREKIVAQESQVEATESHLKRLGVDVDDSELRSPFAGTVVRRFCDEGDMLNAQHPVYEVIESGHLEARIGVPPRLLGALKGQASFALSAAGHEFNGTLRDVVSQVDQATRTQTVVLSLDAPYPQEVADGQLVRMAMKERFPVDGFRVPITALVSASRGLWLVYVVDCDRSLAMLGAVAPAESDVLSNTGVQGVVRSQVVEVLHTDGEFAVVRGAVLAGEQVVADGTHRVVPGQPVVPRQSSLAEMR